MDLIAGLHQQLNWFHYRIPNQKFLIAWIGSSKKMHLSASEVFLEWTAVHV